MDQNKKIKLAIFVDKFPAISETFIIDELAALIDEGVDLHIFSFRKGSTDFISEKFQKYDLSGKTHYLRMPRSNFRRIIFAFPLAFKILFQHPVVLLRSLNLRIYRFKDIFSLKFIYWINWFSEFYKLDFDLAHCHFGTTANKFMFIKEFFKLPYKFVTTFYGQDASRIFTIEGENVYDRLKKECDLFFTMSQNMKDRLVTRGFDSEKLIIHPPGIEVEKYPFQERHLNKGEIVNIVSVGRFVEKKGFDDLLNALAIVKQKTETPFHCTIVGGGILKEELLYQSKKLNLDDVIDWKGYMKIEDIIPLLTKMHFFVQPSKTSASGDME